MAGSEEQVAALRGLHVETATENDSQGFLRISCNQPLFTQLSVSRCAGGSTEEQQHSVDNNGATDDKAPGL